MTVKALPLGHQCSAYPMRRSSHMGNAWRPPRRPRRLRRPCRLQQQRERRRAGGRGRGRSRARYTLLLGESAVAAVQANTHRPGVQGICGCMGAWVHGCAVHLVLVRPQRRQGHSSDIPHPRRAANLNTSQRPTRAGHELSTCTVAILRDDSPRAQCKAVWPRKAILKSCAESRRGSIFINMSGARYDGGGVVRGGCIY